MLRFVQNFLERTANFLFGGYTQKLADSYETVSAVLDERQENSQEEVHQVTPYQLRKIKREFFSRALQSGVASLHFDPSMPGTVVPDRFRGQSILVLNYSYRYHISDFNFDDNEVVASLSFGGVPHRCVVPWDAVMGISNQSETVYYSFVPQALPVKEIERQPLDDVKKEKQESDKTSHEQALERRGQFKVIMGEKK